MTQTKKERLTQMKAYATAFIQGVRTMDQRRHILEPLVRDKEIKDALRIKFEGTDGVRAYNNLAPWLAQDLIGDLARLFLDKKEKAASFVNIYRKASEPKMYAALRKQFSCLFDESSSIPIAGLTEEQCASARSILRKKDREDLVKSFEKGWNSVSAAKTDIERDSIAEKFKKFRDKYHAHLEMTPLGTDPRPFDLSELNLIYNDILTFADRYMPAAFELARILTGTVHDVEVFSNIHKKSGTTMWRLLANLPQSIN
jgi:hypothetical protein